MFADLKKTVLIWWTTKDEAREIADGIKGGDVIASDNLTAAILARAGQISEPSLRSNLVFGLRLDDLAMDPDNPVCNEAIRRSGIAFYPHQYAHEIADIGKGFVTDRAFELFDIAEIAAEVEAKDAAVKAIYDAAIPLTLTDMTPEESEARTAAARERQHDYTPRQRELIEAARFINEDAPKPTDFKTVAAVLRAYSEGRISEEDACRLLHVEPDELAESMAGSEIPMPTSSTPTGPKF